MMVRCGVYLAYIDYAFAKSPTSSILNRDTRNDYMVEFFRTLGLQSYG